MPSIVGDPVRSLVLLFALCAIGWGLGLGAALLLRSVRGDGPGQAIRLRMLGVLLALLVGGAALYGYSLVLAEVGVIGTCDMPTIGLTAC